MCLRIGLYVANASHRSDPAAGKQLSSDRSYLLVVGRQGHVFLSSPGSLSSGLWVVDLLLSGFVPLLLCVVLDLEVTH